MYIKGVNEDFSQAACSYSTCQFRYASQYTPSAWGYSSLSGSGGNPAHLYRAYGQIYGLTADFSEASNYEITLAGYSCALDPAYQSYNGGGENIVDGSGTGIVKW